MWECGLDSVVRTLERFCPRCPSLLFEVCWALNSAMQSASNAEMCGLRTRELLHRGKVSDLVSRLLWARAPLESETHLANEALLTLGLLEGVTSVRQAMEAFPESLAVQTAACQVVVE